jgi:hypothetical protein
MFLQRKISNDGGNNQPQQAFDEEKHKTEKAEAFYDLRGGIFTFLRAFLHTFKINFPEKLFKSFSAIR